MDSSIPPYNDTTPPLQYQRSNVSDSSSRSSRPWRDLPHELLENIAKRFGIVDLLRFRSVCKDWNLSSATLSAETESSAGKHPWLLTYHQNSDESTLLNSSKTPHKIKTPELNGAHCIASKDGWLLVMKLDSVFFFCPFSHARIDLPKLPNTDSSNYLGAFTNPPTSQDGIVAVICQNGNSLSLYRLQRGEKAWSFEPCDQSSSRKIVCAAWHEDKLLFFDDGRNCFKFFPGKKKCKRYHIVSGLSSLNAKYLPFATASRGLDEGEMELLKQGEDGVSVEICGTGFVANEKSDLVTVLNNVEIGSEGVESGKRLKGARIHPRLFYVDRDYEW